LSTQVKLKVATVFSGIGAFEFALKRLNINHEIVFACDNGNRNIDINVSNELEKIRKLATIKEKLVYENALYESNTVKRNFVQDSYMANYKITNNAFFQDVRLLDGLFFRNKVDVFVGGSPCQSFSVIGSREGLNDTRGTLFYDYVRLLTEIKPKVFIFENVFGLFNHDKGNTWQIIKKVFDDSGYFYKFKILNAKDYGIPQSRRRLFLIGFLNKKEFEYFEFPLEKKLNRTMQNFLIDNVKDGYFKHSQKGEIVYQRINGKPNEKLYLSQKLINYVFSPGTKNFYHPNSKIDLPIARAILSTQGNTHRATVNNYITTEGRVRALDPRESLRLMGFTDEFKIVVSKAQSYKQSGNSIVVDVLMNLIESILEAKWKEKKQN
jgi:DNA (cytosine-5)-methyltransferase 1